MNAAERLKQNAEMNAGAIMFAGPSMTASTTNTGLVDVQFPAGYKSIRGIFCVSVRGLLEVLEKGSNRVVMSCPMDAQPNLGFLVNWPINEGQRNFSIRITSLDGDDLAATVVSFLLSPRPSDVIGCIIASAELDAGTTVAATNVQLPSGYQWLKAIYTRSLNALVTVTEQASGVILVSAFGSAMPAFGFMLNCKLASNLNYTTQVKSGFGSTVNNQYVCYHLEAPASL